MKILILLILLSIIIVSCHQKYYDMNKIRTSYQELEISLKSSKAEIAQLKEQIERLQRAVSEINSELLKCNKENEKLREVVELAEELATHPAVFSEAELRNESLKIRRDKFMQKAREYLNYET